MHKNVDIYKELVIHAVIREDDTITVMHTHGLNKYGWPELEVYGIHAFLISITKNIMNSIANWLINDIKKLPEDDSIENHTVIIDDFATGEIRFLLSKNKKSMLLYRTAECDISKKLKENK